MPGTTRITVTLTAAVALSGCAAGLYDVDRTESEAIAPDNNTSLARAADAWQRENPDLSGFLPVSRGIAALGTRLEMIEAAERSVDAQYFIMKNDTSGALFANALVEAAQRGVRVRLLLDDLATDVNDANLILLDMQPNIEVRIFNPIGRGGIYFANMVANFKRANRRMHNKTFIVDNRFGIVGGRNIGDEYFELPGKSEFVDFDMLFVGDVAWKTSITFDRFWNHELSVPMSAYAERFTEAKLERERSKARAAIDSAVATAYEAARSASILDDVLNGLIKPYTGTASVITDDPEKLLTKAGTDYRYVITELTRALDQAEEEVLIVTPYLIPGANGLAYIEALRERGVRVAILTNSLASNNHVPVHGAYQRYRKPLLRAGVELYEVRSTAAADYSALGVVGDADIGALSMHTKGVLIDNRYIFVGSLNIDPRAIDVNTEVGVMIDSESLGRALAETAAARIGAIAYQLSLDENERLVWEARIGDGVVVRTSDPDAGAWRRFLAWVSKILPEQQL